MRKPGVRGKHCLIASIILALGITLGAAACSGTSSTDASGQQQESVQSSDIQSHYEAVQPAYQPQGLSEYRKTLNDIEASQTLGIQTTSFFFNQGNQDPMFQCLSIGDPVPNTAQLTNPDQVIPDPNASYGSVTIGNMDPNGVYAPSSSSGTNVMCVNSANQEYLAYWEGFVLTVNGAATWNPAAHKVELTGVPAMPVCSIATVKAKKVTVCTNPAAKKP